MYNINPIYTGENSSVRLPELDAIERSSRRNSEMQVRGEEMKLDKALRDKDTFQKMLAIDPIMAVSTANATRQAQDLEKYNNKWSGRYVKGKGELSFADEMEMSKDKNLLQATQNKMLADQEQYKTYKQTILRDTRGYYDKQNFDRTEQEYFKTGVLPPNLMDVAPQSMTAWLRARSKEMPTTTVPRKDAMGRIIDEKVVDKTDAQNVILEGMQEQARLKDIVREFDQWSNNPANVKEAYALLDRDKDGVIDPAENQYAHQNTNVTDNPIAKWAMNNPVYLESVMGTKEGASKNSPSAKTTFDWNTGVNEKNNQNSKFNTQGSTVVASIAGDITFPDYQNLGQVSQTSETQNIPEVIVKDDKGNEVTKPLNETALFHIVGFSKTKDQLSIQLDGNTSGNATYDKGDILVVPASRFDDLLKKKPFGIFRGQQQTTTSPIHPSGVKWKTNSKDIH